jgi:hypothetical protein
MSWSIVALDDDETGWLRNKSMATRLGFAVQLRFLPWRGRFPKMRGRGRTERKLALKSIA